MRRSFPITALGLEARVIFCAVIWLLTRSEKSHTLSGSASSLIVILSGTSPRESHVTQQGYVRYSHESSGDTYSSREHFTQSLPVIQQKELAVSEGRSNHPKWGFRLTRSQTGGTVLSVGTLDLIR